MDYKKKGCNLIIKKIFKARVYEYLYLIFEDGGIFFDRKHRQYL